MPVVTKIPATKSKYTAVPIEQAHKRRVAGYARVSTDKDEQTTSYAAQVDYYDNCSATGAKQKMRRLWSTSRRQRS